MSNAAIAGRKYYSNFKNTGLAVSVATPTIVGNTVQYTFHYPWLFNALLTLGNLPASGSPVYANSLITAPLGTTQNTYAPMLAAMMIAAMYANRDYDEPNGITGYTPLPGDSNNWNGYFKNLLNDSLKPTNYNSFIALINKITNYWANRSTFTAAQCAFSINATDINQWFGMPVQLWDNNLLLPPGTYSFNYANVAPLQAPYSTLLKAFHTAFGIAALLPAIFELKPIA